MQDQWQRKKQTKEQKRAAKKAKLDPANQKTAKDVMDENERKRKRELGIGSDNDDTTEIPQIESQERPGEGIRKRQKTDKPEQKQTSAAADEDAVRAKAKAEKRKEKRDMKKEKIQRKKEKLEAKKARKQETAPESTEAEAVVDGEDSAGEDDTVEDAEIERMDTSGLAEDDAEDAASDSSVPTTPGVDSPAFDVSADQSTASSSSSIVPPATAPTQKTKQTTSKAPSSDESQAKSKKEKAFNLPKIDSEELQSRLKARIQELRERRKANGPEGQPARSRQELLEARRQKSDARKQHKKELRRRAKEEEERINNERLRGSGSPLIQDPFTPSPSQETNNFSFGRVAFEDGAQVDPSMSGYFSIQKRNPKDPRTALQGAQNKAERLAGMEQEKRAEIEQKDLWLNAKKRAHGERVRDDQSLLKKALKRKEKGKAKSEKEWNERIEGVRKGKEMKQKRREENLAKRKDEKGSSKKGKAKGGAKGGAKGKPKGRPGFEGRFKS